MKRFTQRKNHTNVRLVKEVSAYLKVWKGMIHIGKRPFQCTSCTTCFENFSEMKRHESMHNRERPFQCTKCNNSYFRPSELKNHEKIHTGEKSFQCAICNTVFFRSSSLTRHNKKLHSGNHWLVETSNRILEKYRKMIIWSYFTNSCTL